MRKHIYIRDQYSFSEVRLRCDVSDACIPDYEILFFSRAISSIDLDEDVIITLSHRGAEYYNGWMLPKLLTNTKTKQEELDSRYADIEKKLEVKEYELQELKKDMDKSLKEYYPKTVTIISLIVAIIPLLTVNISLLQGKMNIATILGVNGTILLAISSVYWLIQGLIYTEGIEKKNIIIGGVVTLIAAFLIIASIWIG